MIKGKNQQKKHTHTWITNNNVTLNKKCIEKETSWKSVIARASVRVATVGNNKYESGWRSRAPAKWRKETHTHSKLLWKIILRWFDSCTIIDFFFICIIERRKNNNKIISNYNKIFTTMARLMCDLCSTFKIF